MLPTLAYIYLAVVAVLSLFTFLLYGWDKRQARKDRWRTPESRLHVLALLGGWPGALLGQRFFRHKTQKLGFKLITWFAAALHVIAIVGLIYFITRPVDPTIQPSPTGSLTSTLPSDGSRIAIKMPTIVHE